MNDEQIKLARELAKHPRWVWRAGVQPCATELAPYVWGKLGRVEEGGWVPQYCDDIALPHGWPDARREAWPDLTDDATGGALLGMLGAGWTCEHRTPPSGASEWLIYRRGHLEDCGVHFGSTLAEACARALLAQWAREVTS